MPTTPLTDRLLDIQEVVGLQEFLQREPGIVEIVTMRLQNTIEVARWSDSLLKATFVSQVAEELKRRNSSNSAFEKYHLPVEITVSVIHLAAPMIHPFDFACARDYFPQLHVIAQISTFFRDIILHSPPLWAVADYRYPLPFVKLALRRSLQCPLAIDMASYRWGMGYPEKDFIDTITPHVARCRHLYVTTPLDGSGRQLVERPAPMVSTAYLKSCATDLVAPIRLFGGRADRLRSLRVTGGGIVWDAIEFPHLEMLSIEDSTPSSTNLPSVRSLIQCLKTSRDLVDLSLAHLTLNLDASLQDITPVHLPRLKNLRLETDGPPDLACHILPLLRAPALSSFFIELGLWREEAEVPVSAILQRTLQHFISSFIAAFQRGGSIEMEVGKNYLSLSQSEPEDADLLFQSEKLDTVIRWLGENLAPILRSELLSLEISGGDAAYCSTGLLSLLIDTVPNLKDLSVHTTLPVSRLLEVLASPQPDSGAYPFPNLVRLTLRTNGQPELILEMLMKRYGHGEVISTNLPRPLEFLCLSGLKGWPDGFRQRLEVLIGEGEIRESWREPDYEYED